LGNRIIDVKVFKPNGGPISDQHHAVRMKIRLPNKMRPNYANKTTGMPESKPIQPRTYISWNKSNDDPDTLVQYRETVDTILMIDEAIKPGDPSPTSLSTAIMMAAKTLLKEPREDISDWFKMSAESMHFSRDRLRAAYDR
jgi:hypothetical protein